MKEVLCWCCEHFCLLSDSEAKTKVYGECKELNKNVDGFDRVCELFLLNSGLHTERIIPDCCVNYKKPL